jgi:HEAT repeat protein
MSREDEVTELRIDEIDRRYVTSGHRHRYLTAGNLRSLDDAALAAFGRALGEDAGSITDDELRLLFAADRWRERLVAAWLAGVDERRQFQPLIAELLLANEYLTAGQGYCTALALFGESADAEALVAFLDEHLDKSGSSQDWALGALLFLDEKHGTNRTGRFLAPGGPWERSSLGGFPETYGDPDSHHRKLAQMVAFVENHCR